ncbi:hypothetical protein AC1031_005976 [Aphanomyces cochlioides]|nr:hypothetical protein AC1031_005976 [Aphanomyces cochlioides]
MTVIGGGVVGAAVFRDLVLRGYSVVLLEKNSNLVHGASCGNSGIACTGYDAPEDSLERRCIRRAMLLNPKVYRELGLPSAPVGSLVVAWTQEELAALPHIIEANHNIGDKEVRLLSKEELYNLEPYLAPGAHGAVLVPGETVIEPWLLPLAYVHHGIANGGSVRLEYEVNSGTFSNGVWTLNCANHSPVQAHYVLNCAGLYGDIVERIHSPSVPFHIRPRKGQYVVYDAPDLVKSIIQPIPTDRTKGVFVFRTLYGHVLVGPTAEDQEARDNAANTPEVLSMLRQTAVKIVPALSTRPIVGSYAGLRPATEHRDYQIDFDQARHWVTVGGIRSTGATASLAIGEYVGSLVASAAPPRLKQSVVEFRLPSLQELADHHLDISSNTIELGEHRHALTHPISRFGLVKLRDPSLKPTSHL